MRRLPLVVLAAAAVFMMVTPAFAQHRYRSVHDGYNPTSHPAGRAVVHYNGSYGRGYTPVRHYRSHNDGYNPVQYRRSYGDGYSPAQYYRDPRYGDGYSPAQYYSDPNYGDGYTPVRYIPDPSRGDGYSPSTQVRCTPPPQRVVVVRRVHYVSRCP
ncbi:MAG: hypothetical protein KDD66_00205 [Bdellovibrionales bacterium]|nr:hypothetical protein [Bdellovibrionales bacterium]